MNWWTILIAFSVIVVVAVIAEPFFTRAENERRKAVEKRGYSLAESDASVARSVGENLPWPGRAFKARNVISMPHDRGTAVYGTLRYKTGRNNWTHTRFLALPPDERLSSLSALTIGPARFNLTKASVRTEWAAFNDLWHVDAADPAQAHALLTQEMQEYLMETTRTKSSIERTIVLKNGVLTVFSSEDYSIDHAERLLGFIVNFEEKIPRFLRG